MALSRLAAQFAAEIAQHDWSDAPFRADRAGHRRENDSPSKVASTPQLDAHGTESVRINVMWVTAQVLAYNDPNFDVYEFARACGIGEVNTYGARWGRGIEMGLRGEPGNFVEPGKPLSSAKTRVPRLPEATAQESKPAKCTHSTRGQQEHILGSGTGDYHCTSCGEPMPIVAKPRECYVCKSSSGRLEPDPVHGKSWHCLDCGKNWGWVRS